MTEKQIFSYLFGLFGTDGSPKVWNNQLKAIQLEVSIIDKEDIEKISKILEGTVTERIRETNFSIDNHTCTLYTSNTKLIQFLIEGDFPIKDKTNMIKKPTNDYDEDYFWLGVIDGDGSIGLKSTGYPFINLTTKSELLKNDFLDYIEKNTGFRPTCNKNTRDNIYNIGLGSEKAQILGTKIFSDKEIGLTRKQKKYQEMMTWKKQDLSKVKKIPWTLQEEEDLFLLSLDEFIQKYPNRTINAIRGKKQRLRRTQNE